MPEEKLSLSYDFKVKKRKSKQMDGKEPLNWVRLCWGMIGSGRGAPQHAGCIRGAGPSRGGASDKGGDPRLSLPYRRGARPDSGSGLLERLP